MEALGFGLGFSAVVYFIVIPLLHLLAWVGVGILVLQVLACLGGCRR
jgi:hypothetical protein